MRLIFKNNIIYSMPILDDLSQGSRIAYIRQFRNLSQDDVSDSLGLTGESKRRTMTRYEKGERAPKEERLKVLAKILLTNINLIKVYDFKSESDLVYFLLWLEIKYPNLRIDINTKNEIFNKFLEVWNEMRLKYQAGKIKLEDYIEWKITYEYGE